MPEVELPNPDDVKELLKDQFTKMVALTVAVYAVALAVTSLGGNDAAEEMVMAQQQASNNWAYYQAKVIRETQCRLQRKHVEYELAVLGDGSPAARLKLEELHKYLADEEKRYGGDKEQIKEKAESHENERDHNQKKDPYFDYAEVLLQIAIVLASVAMLSGVRLVYHFSLALAAVGALFAFNGFTLLVSLPFFGS